MPRVLIAEDSAILCTLLGDALRAHGVADDVESFADGASLLSAFRLYRQAKQPITLVILDVELPGGPNGLVIGRSLRALETQLGVTTVTDRAPVLFFSAQATSASIESAVTDCFPARYAQKRDAGPAGIAFEAAVLLQSLLVP